MHNPAILQLVHEGLIMRSLVRSSRRFAVALALTAVPVVAVTTLASPSPAQADTHVASSSVSYQAHTFSYSNDALFYTQW